MILAKLQRAGGKIVTEYAEATHVLIHHYVPGLLDPIIQEVVQHGVWFMGTKWAIKCLDDNAKYPELGQHIRGGAPVLI